MAQGKRMKEARKSIEPEKHYPIEEAAVLVKSCASAKFDETVEIAVRLGVDPRHADQMVRGACDLPHGSGRKVNVAVFAKGAAAEAAKAAGADKVGADDLAKEIEEKGVPSDIHRCVATPDMMPLVGKLGKVLGPRGLMPNPKSGTVTPDPAAAVQKIKQGRVEFRVEKEGIVHAIVGKASFGAEKLAANIHAFMDALEKAKPSGAKGVYVRAISLSSTMGPGVRVEAKRASG